MSPKGPSEREVRRSGSAEVRAMHSEDKGPPAEDAAPLEAGNGEQQIHPWGLQEEPSPAEALVPTQ